MRSPERVLHGEHEHDGRDPCEQDDVGRAQRLPGAELRQVDAAATASDEQHGEPEQRRDDDGHVAIAERARRLREVGARGALARDVEVVLVRLLPDDRTGCPRAATARSARRPSCRPRPGAGATGRCRAAPARQGPPRSRAAPSPRPRRRARARARAARRTVTSSRHRSASATGDRRERDRGAVGREVAADPDDAGRRRGEHRLPGARRIGR